MFLEDYIIVFLSCISILYIGPRFIFNGIVKKQSAMFKIFFCVCSSMTVGALIFIFYGLLNILSSLSICITFFGSFILAVIFGAFKFTFIDDNNFTDLFKKFKNKYVNEFPLKIKKILNNPNFGISLVVIICIILLANNFVDYARTHVKFGFSDMIRHEIFMLQVINGEMLNDIYYPISMHSIIISLNFIYDISITVLLKYAGNISCILFFVALYGGVKTIFQSRYTACLVFLLFLLLCNFLVTQDSSIRMIYDGLHRFNGTLPQEFALFAVFVAPVCLINIMKSKGNIKSRSNILGLLLFALTITTSMLVHTYITIFQFITCLATFIAYITKINKEKFVALVISVISSVFIGFLPLIVVVARGKQLSKSVSWAVDLPSGDSRVFEDIASVNKSQANIEAFSSSNDIFSSFMSSLKSLYEDGVAPLFSGAGGICVVILLFIAIVVLIICAVRKCKNFENYLSIFIALILFIVLYAAPLLNIIRVIESYRVVICLYSTILAFICISFDIVFSNLSKNK